MHTHKHLPVWIMAVAFTVAGLACGGGMADGGASNSTGWNNNYRYGMMGW